MTRSDRNILIAGTVIVVFAIIVMAPIFILPAIIRVVACYVDAPGAEVPFQPDVPLSKDTYDDVALHLTFLSNNYDTDLQVKEALSYYIGYRVQWTLPVIEVTTRQNAVVIVCGRKPDWTKLSPQWNAPSQKDRHYLPDAIPCTCLVIHPDADPKRFVSLSKRSPYNIDAQILDIDITPAEATIILTAPPAH